MATLTVYRAAAARLLGPFIAGTATGGTSTTLVSSNWPFTSTLTQNDLYQDYYLMRPGAAATGDVSRIVQTYTASSGTFLVDQSYTNAPVADSFELHGHPIEPYTQLLNIINEGLKRLFVVVEVSFQPTAGDTRQELTGTWPWLLDARWVYQAGVIFSGEDRDLVDPYIVHPLRGTVTAAAPLIYFEWTPRSFVGTEYIFLRCIKRVYDHCAGTLSIPTITNATNASPIVITTSGAHGFTTGAQVVVLAVGGNTQANGTWDVTFLTPTTFSLNGSAGNANYTSGGTCYTTFGGQSGLTLETDTAYADDQWVASAAAMVAWDRYGHLLEQTANQKIIRDATKAAAWFNEMTEWNFQEPLRTLQPIHSWGPYRYGTGIGW